MLAAMVLVGKYLTVNLSNISRPKIDMLSAVLSIAGFGGLVYASSNFAICAGGIYPALCRFRCAGGVVCAPSIPFGHAIVEPRAFEYNSSDIAL